ncbi:hypothetical protein NLI96_g13200 [Meripilus lineatus]|uniref:Uncharacterized protein n=1 Tax=Meripilus lineatus TaxID=2056292 RepID=A0AAD5Y7I5_9APHY|nr:hypothetical protein NLI96_g13200 [Physisporinus lineatus]
MLQDLNAADIACGNANALFFQSVPSDYQYASPEEAAKVDNSQTLNLETKRRHAKERYDRLLLEVMEMELRMGIQRWQPSHPRYQSTLKYISQRKYHQALNKVYRLVVLRLFELHKLNLSQTESRTDLTTRQWSATANREFVKLRRRISRAKEEITRCEVEARRLHTAILDEDRHFKQVLAQLRLSQDIILVAVQDFVSRRLQINTRVLADLKQLFSLEGFTGDPTPGQPVSPIFRESSHIPQPSAEDSHSDPPALDHPPDDDGDEIGVIGPDEGAQEDLGRLEELFNVLELS